MRIQSFIQPDKNSCVGYLLSIKDFVPHNDGDDTIINMICRSLSGTSCCSKIGIIALRILFTIGVIVAAAVDLVIWTLKTITVIPAIRRGCPEHLADFTSALFCSVTAIAIIFGYPPIVREDIEIKNFESCQHWEFSRFFYSVTSPHQLILGMIGLYEKQKGFVDFLDLVYRKEVIQKKREQHLIILKQELELGVFAEASDFFEFEKFHKNMSTFVEKINKLQMEFGKFNEERARSEIPPLQHEETQKMITELEEITMTCRYSSVILNCLKAYLAPQQWKSFNTILDLLMECEKYAQFLVDKKQELVDARQKFRDKTVSFLPVNEGSKNLILGFLLDE